MGGDSYCRGSSHRAGDALVTRAQIRFVFGFVGCLLMLLAGCFARDGEIPWMWAIPLMGLAGAVLIAGLDRRGMRKRGL
jgi:peptidoglycan/LPS O-acetylase OafA/YrhL